MLALLLGSFGSVLCSQSTICKHIFLMFLPTSWQQSSAISNELINLIVDEAWNSSFTLLAAPWQHRGSACEVTHLHKPVYSSLFLSSLCQYCVQRNHSWKGDVLICRRTPWRSFETKILWGVIKDAEGLILCWRNYLVYFPSTPSEIAKGNKVSEM